MHTAYQNKDEYAISLFTLVKLPLKDALAEVSARGFHSVELWAEGCHLDPRLDPQPGDAKSWLRHNGQSVHSIHAPFQFHRQPHPAQAEAFRAYRIALGMQTIDICEAVNCPILVVHALNRSDSNCMEYQLPQLREELEALVAYGKAHGVSVAVENIVSSSQPVAGEFVCTLKHQVRSFSGIDCRYCLDIGHAPLSGVSLYDEVDAASDRLVSFHIHNNDGVHDTHDLPECGVIDWPALYQYARGKGYQGQFVFEVAGGPTVEASLARLDGLSRLFG